MDVESLPDAALLALALDAPQPGERAHRAAAELVQLPRWQGHALGAAGLVARYGIPPEWAARVEALYELAERRHRTGLPAIRSARDALLVLDDLRRSPVEVAAVLLLDPGYRPIGVRTVGVGSINRVSLLPRDVLAPAVREGAAAIVVAHTHPSGDATPSAADRRVTEALRLAADLFAIPVLDHLILAPRSSYSFAEKEGWRTATSQEHEDPSTGGRRATATQAA